MIKEVRGMDAPFWVKIEEDEKFAGDYDFPGLRRGGAFSVFMHVAIFILVAMVTQHQQKSQLLLTEITLVDQIIPIPEVEAPPPLPVAPPKETNVWDFLKQALPLPKKPELSAELPIELPKKMDQPKLSAMSEALKLGDKKDLDKPALNQPLDLVGRKAVKAPAGMNVNPLQMTSKQQSLAVSSNLPTGISLGKKSGWLPTRQDTLVDTQRFARRANLQARGGSLADMPTIKKEVSTQKKIDLNTSGLTLKREQNTFKIFGPLENRPILEKYLPRYPRWAEEQGLECQVSLHFFVLPDGRVKENLFVEQSSGYSEMDQLTVQALRAFRFAPLPSSERQEEQEGVIIFYFRLSR